MVGGIVVGVQHRPENVRLLVQGTGHDQHIEVTRLVHSTTKALAVRPGDVVWWQGELVLWSSDDLGVEDIHLAQFHRDFKGHVYLISPLARAAAGWPEDQFYRPEVVAVTPP